MNHSRHPVNTLPDHVRVFASRDQIKPLMVYAKPPNSEGKQMSKGYMKMFAENRILPREPYFGVDGRKYVDAVIGDVSTIRTFRRDTKNLTAGFAKKLKQGLVLTPTQGIIDYSGAKVKRLPVTAERVENLNKKAAVVAEIRTSNGSIGKEARMKVTRTKLNKVLTKKGNEYKASVAQARKAERDDFEMYKRDNTDFKQVYFRFVCETRSVLDVPVISKYKYSKELTSPVIRALVRFATSRTFDKLKYQFKKEDGTYDYKPLTDFLEFCSTRQWLALAKKTTRPRNTVLPSRNSFQDWIIT